jgi:hypothetical protein
MYCYFMDWVLEAVKVKSVVKALPEEGFTVNEKRFESACVRYLLQAAPYSLVAAWLTMMQTW